MSRRVASMIALALAALAQRGCARAEEPKRPEVDRIATDKGDLTIRPIQHATLVMEWNGKTIYVDPVGGAGAFADLPKPDLVLLTLGGKNVYIAGDTEDIPEMRALTNIDVAFLPMNLPYTMDVRQAAEAVRQFRPKIVYPYHYRNADKTKADLAKFRELVGVDVGVEVRIRDWYR